MRATPNEIQAVTCPPTPPQNGPEVLPDLDRCASSDNTSWPEAARHHRHHHQLESTIGYPSGTSASSVHVLNPSIMPDEGGFTRFSAVMF